MYPCAPTGSAPGVLQLVISAESGNSTRYPFILLGDEEKDTSEMNSEGLKPRPLGLEVKPVLLHQTAAKSQPITLLVHNLRRSLVSRCLMTFPAKLQCNETYPHNGTLEDYTYRTPWQRATVKDHDQIELPLADQIMLLDISKANILEPMTGMLRNNGGANNCETYLHDVIPSSNPDSPPVCCEDLLHIRQRLHAASEETLNIGNSGDKHMYIEAPLAPTIRNSIPRIESLATCLAAIVVQDPFIQQDGKEITEEHIFRNERLYNINKHMDGLWQDNLCYEQFESHPQSIEQQFLEETQVMNDLQETPDDVKENLTTEDLSGVTDLDDDMSKLGVTQQTLSENYDTGQQHMVSRTPEEIFILINESSKHQQRKYLHEDAVLESPSQSDTTQMPTSHQEMMEALEKEILSPFQFPVLMSPQRMEKLSQVMWTREKFFKDIASLIIKVPVTDQLVLTNLIDEAKLLLNARNEQCSGDLELSLTWDPIALSSLEVVDRNFSPESFGSKPDTDIKPLSVVEEFFPLEYTEDFTSPKITYNDEHLERNPKCTTKRTDLKDHMLIEDQMDHLMMPISGIIKNDNLSSADSIVNKKEESEEEMQTNELSKQWNENEKLEVDGESLEMKKNWNEKAYDMEKQKNNENEMLELTNMEKQQNEKELVMENQWNEHKKLGCNMEKEWNENSLEVEKQQNEKEKLALVKSDKQIKRQKILHEEIIEKSVLPFTGNPVEDFYMIRKGRKIGTANVKKSGKMFEIVETKIEAKSREMLENMEMRSCTVPEEVHRNTEDKGQENTCSCTPKKTRKDENPTKERQKKTKIKIIEISLPESYQEIMNMIQMYAHPIIMSLKEGGHLDEGVTFYTLKPITTRFMLKQKHLLQHKNKHEYKLTVLLHALVSSAGLLYHCDLATACLHLRALKEKYKHIIHDELCHLTQSMIITLHRLDKEHVQSPKITELVVQLQNWYTRKITKEGSDLEPKILVIVSYDAPSLVNSICRAIGSLTCFVCKDMQQASSSYSNISSQLDHCNCLVLKEMQISDDFPWAHFSLIVEYEDQHQSPWKQMCLRQNIRYIALKIRWPSDNLSERHNAQPTKPLEEAKDVVHTIIGSSTVTSNHELLHLLEARFNIQVLERDYLKQSSSICQPFPDIVINETTCIVLLPVKQLTESNAAESVINRIAGLSLQCCHCTVLVCNNDASTSYTYSGHTVNNLARLHAVTSQYSPSAMDYEVKVLYCYGNEQTAKIVRSISDASMESSSIWNTSENWLSETMSKQEKFLLSLPCFNSISAQKILFSHCLKSIFKMTLPSMIEVFHWLPTKVLEVLHSILHCDEDKKPNLELSIKQTIPFTDTTFTEETVTDRRGGITPTHASKFSTVNTEVKMEPHHTSYEYSTSKNQFNARYGMFASPGNQSTTKKEFTNNILDSNIFPHKQPSKKHHLDSESIQDRYYSIPTARDHWNFPSRMMMNPTNDLQTFNDPVFDTCNVGSVTYEQVNYHGSWNNLVNCGPNSKSFHQPKFNDLYEDEFGIGSQYSNKYLKLNDGEKVACHQHYDNSMVTENDRSDQKCMMYNLPYGSHEKWKLETSTMNILSSQSGQRQHLKQEDGKWSNLIGEQLDTDFEWPLKAERYANTGLDWLGQDLPLTSRGGKEN
ncbi:uncharacterized protein LOC117117343 [Anneissia japonica]|uniref:uncharacterized protein LOC117117343 n=1 Tax=Anneissia japonica TaxID=1529436 RepID=UPI00142580AF|nr:uncharacterized protein LOC117117343 [Anneissia japonica]